MSAGTQEVVEIAGLLLDKDIALVFAGAIPTLLVAAGTLIITGRQQAIRDRRRAESDRDVLLDERGRDAATRALEEIVTLANVVRDNDDVERLDLVKLPASALDSAEVAATQIRDPEVREAVISAVRLLPRLRGLIVNDLIDEPGRYVQANLLHCCSQLIAATLRGDEGASKNLDYIASIAKMRDEWRRELGRRMVARIRQRD